MKIIAIFLITLSLFSCNGKKIIKDDYYTDHGDWDDVRFPLIKLYEALCINGSDNWFVQLTPGTDGLFSVPGAKKVNIVHGMIFIYSTKINLNYADAPEAWFVLIPKKHIEKGFATHKEFLDYLHQISIQNEPKLYNMDKVEQFFGNHDTIDWNDIDN